MATKISTNNAPAAIGPYSQAIVAGDFLFASGQIPINPATGNVEATDITGQAEQSMKNVGAILEAAGASGGPRSSRNDAGKHSKDYLLPQQHGRFCSFQ